MTAGEATSIVTRDEVFELAQILVVDRPESPWHVSKWLHIEGPSTDNLGRLRRIRKQAMDQHTEAKAKITREFGNQPYFDVALKQVDSLFENYLRMVNDRIRQVRKKTDK